MILANDPAVDSDTTHPIGLSRPAAPLGDPSAFLEVQQHLADEFHPHQTPFLSTRVDNLVLALPGPFQHRKSGVPRS